MSFYGDIQRWWIGSVVEDSGKSDPTGLGRCKVRIDGIHGPDILDEDLPYVQTIMPSTSGGTSGNVETPQLLRNARVIGIFLDGVLSQLPVIWGYLPFTEKPNITQQNIIAKEKRPIVQTHSTQNFITTPANLENPNIGLSNIEKAWNFFSGPYTKRKYKKEQIAGILGNLVHESTFSDTFDIDPLAHELLSSRKQKKIGYGIAQWTLSQQRYADLKTFASLRNASKDDLLIQLAYIDHELDNFLWARKSFFETQTVVQATMQFMRYYLRPEILTELTTLYPFVDGGSVPGNHQTINARTGEKDRFKNANKIYIRFTQGNQ
jgi:hypothetical protein